MRIGVAFALLLLLVVSGKASSLSVQFSASFSLQAKKALVSLLAPFEPNLDSGNSSLLLSFGVTPLCASALALPNRSEGGYFVFCFFFFQLLAFVSFSSSVSNCVDCGK